MPHHQGLKIFMTFAPWLWRKRFAPKPFSRTPRRCAREGPAFRCRRCTAGTWL